MRGVTAAHSISKLQINFPFVRRKNNMDKIDFSMIKTVRVPHQQFESIKNKAKYLMIQDKDKGDVLTFSLACETVSSNTFKAVTHVKGIFVGKDGSMGFKRGKEYQFTTCIRHNMLCVVTSDGLWCPYSNMEKLLENWRIIDDK